RAFGYADQLDPLRLDPVQRDPLAGEPDRRRRDVHADHLGGAAVQQEPDHVVPGAAAVVEDHLPAVVAPEPGQLAEERVLPEPPLEELGRLLGALELLRPHRVRRPVALDLARARARARARANEAHPLSVRAASRPLRAAGGAGP